MTVSNKIENIKDVNEIVPIASPDHRQTDKEYVSVVVGNKLKDITEMKEGIPTSHEDYQRLDQEYITMPWLTWILMVFVVLVLLFAFVIKIHRVRRKYAPSCN